MKITKFKIEAKKILILVYLSAIKLESQNSLNSKYNKIRVLTLGHL